ncbi:MULTISPECIES: GNAT family N-acetyltransferase [Achromobacter]|uniref:N-acetyltransferase n=1 Tax=Alcaligenes xylosoxydans xylosoxydans TaxID=85698 RepID=A0A424W6X7_ALCXX|nr:MULTISPECIES: GNAT family N-acetyltransferase [Achromobacter]MBC9908284.1 GNAT family N-acetyltransferase [Achromobacter xylosoxidans]MBD0871972.1 GNAT family N-acetyltransferase [Achromobacter xylosoxidans]MDH1304852.1 GNAT family N-acetyltransferase [Achromobacter sp. GD03932]QNP88624.1 GNAT family N-acetyltransferase [Achromobacter xylosoxidans]RPJ88980.1 N-acetyltransferase [Achromobacter xylosoxidans]
MPLPSRVTLRRMQEDDIPMLLAMESDPEVMRYSTGVKPADEARRQELLAWLREPLTRLGHWAITVDGAAVGWVSLVPLAGTDSIQLAYRLQRAAWGKGYASQAAKQLCEYAWRETEVSELVAVVWPDNQASVRVLEKLGFAFRSRECHYDRETIVYTLPRPAAGSDRFPRP